MSQTIRTYRPSPNGGNVVVRLKDMLKFFCGLSDEEKQRFMTCDWLLQPFYAYFMYARALNCDETDVKAAYDAKKSENIQTNSLPTKIKYPRYKIPYSLG